MVAIADKLVELQQKRPDLYSDDKPIRLDTVDPMTVDGTVERPSLTLYGNKMKDVKSVRFDLPDGTYTIRVTDTSNVLGQLQHFGGSKEISCFAFSMCCCAHPKQCEWLHP